MSTSDTPTPSSNPKHRGRVLWYSATIFVSSALVLVLEIVAARLIAPYVGVSLYSWTSVIGVILAGLSIGNWLGGRWADRGGGETSAGLVLALAGISCLASLFLLTLVAPAIQDSGLNLLGASFLYMFALFFLPALLLGVITPLLTTLALRLDQRAGHIVGRMHALAALGSIVGTFVTGYWLVQYLGTRNIILGSALCLFALAAPYLRRVQPVASAALAMVAILIIGVTYVRDGFGNPCDRESNYFCIRVVDASDTAPFGSAKALILDHLLHGINHQTEAEMMISPYVHLMDELVVRHFGQERSRRLKYFFAGGGSYTQPRAIGARSSNAQVTVAELDPEVTSTAAREMFVDIADMRIIHQDARIALKSLAETFDVIVTDVFHDISIPYHLVTREFAHLVRSRLSENGLYLMNVVDAFPDAKLAKAIIKTLQQEFRFVDIWMDTVPEEPTRVTYVVSASETATAPEQIHAQQGFDRIWYKVTEPLLATGTPIDTLPTLSDNYVPVERMISGLLLTAQGN